MFIENDITKKLFLKKIPRARRQETANQFKRHFEDIGVLI